MFISIQDTEVNQFRKAPARLTRRAKSKHSVVWDGIFIAVLAAGFIAIVVGLITFNTTITSPPTTYDYTGEYSRHNYAPGIIIGVVLFFAGLALMIFAATVVIDIHHNTKVSQWNILHQFRRKYFVTPKDYSYKAVFGGPMLNELSGKDEAACRHWQAANQMFAIQAVIKADRQIAKAGKGLKGIERAYKAKLEIIEAAEKLYSNEAVVQNDHFNDLRAEAERKFIRRLTAIKNMASQKLQSSEELERVHDAATASSTSR